MVMAELASRALCGPPAHIDLRRLLAGPMATVQVQLPLWTPGRLGDEESTTWKFLRRLNPKSPHSPSSHPKDLKTSD